MFELQCFNCGSVGQPDKHGRCDSCGSDSVADPLDDYQPRTMTGIERMEAE